jgi:RNA polymerase sigma-70 factor (ECF subfamily)
MPYQDDLFYIEETKKGDLNAFGILIQKHEKYAFTLALRILKHREEAEEVAQDAFMKAYYGIHSFEGNSKFTTWLYKIIFNEAVGRQRKKKNNWDLIENEVAETIISQDLLGGIENLLAQERKELIQKGLERLKSNESAVLTLFYLEEQSIKEIQEITSYSESQVKILLHRGRKNLFDILQKITNNELINLL